MSSRESARLASDRLNGPWREIPTIALSAMVALALTFWRGWLGYLMESAPPASPFEILALRTALAALAALLLLMAAAPAWRRAAAVIAGALFAFILFYMICGLRLVDPRSTGAVLRGLDGRWNLIAWEFFRREPWHLPPGGIERMMYPVGTSLGNTDGLPLVSFAFKPFAPLLPDEFQFFGLWFLLCALLSGVFAALLMCEIEAPWPFRLLGTALLVWRTSFPSLDHAALMTRSWLVLAALWLYFRPASKTAHRDVYLWLVVAGIGAWTHPYVCVMILPICAAALVRRWWPERVLSLAQVGLGFASVVAFVLVLWWLAGYFALGSLGQMSDTPLGIWSLDLLSPINPARPTAFLPQWQVSETQGDPAYYFGAPMLALAAWAMLSLVWRRPQPSAWKPLVPLLVACVLLTVAALSPKISFGGRVVLELPIQLYALVAPFRASVRFIIPVYFAVAVILFRLLAARACPSTATGILALLVILQMREGYEGFATGYSQHLRGPHTWAKANLDFDTWRTALGARRVIRMMGGQWSVDDDAAIAYLAARLGVATPSGRAARADYRRLNEATEKAERELPDDLYVVHPDALDGFVARGFFCRDIDGYNVCKKQSDVRSQ